MRLRHKTGSEDIVAKSQFCINLELLPEFKDNIKSVFNNENSIELELGMGKGQFIINKALSNASINFIGVEKYATVVLKAIDKIKEYNLESNKLIPNLRYICDDVENLPKYFNNNTINKIYLNFSDPWPKKRHENRRITHHRFLEIYEKLLKENGTIEFKTDNIDLFNFSLDEIKLSNFELLSQTYDLHNDDILNKDNIMTEYEEKFSNKGNKICKYIIKKK